MSESIGAALRTGREQRHLTLGQVSESTRIRVHYLQALENGDLSAIPSAAQARGFLKIYAQFLDLDLESLIPAPAEVPSTHAPDAPMPGVSDTVPARAAEDARGSASPGLLAKLRSRLTRRLRAGPETTDLKARAEAALQHDSDGKKKAQR